MKQLSIIIVTYRSENDIYDCLQSVYKHCDIPQEELEVIVVDNSPESEPMFSTISERFGQRVVLIHNTHNGGYGQGNNVGIQRAQAPVILIMNPDVRLMKPIFGTALNAFRQHPQMSIYGMQQMLSPTEKSHNSFICTDRINGYWGTLLNAVCSRLNWYVPSCMFFSGSCFFVRREMLCTIGMFDESIFMYGEEADIHYRMSQRYGHDMKYNPRLCYIHLTKERELELSTLKKTLDSCICQNEKNGQPRHVTLLHRWQSNRLQLWREWVRMKLLRKPSHAYPVLSEYDKYLKEEMQKTQ